MEDKQGKKIILTQKLEIDIIELPKIIGKEKEQDNLLDWLYFLENPKSERVTEKMKENENLKEAVKKLDNLSEDEKMQRIADLRQKAIMDEKAIYEKGLEIGIEKGIQDFSIWASNNATSLDYIDPNRVGVLFYDQRKKHFGGKGILGGKILLLSSDKIRWHLDEKLGLALEEPDEYTELIGFSVPSDVIMTKEKEQ